MIRLLAFTTFAASLLFWSVQVSAQIPVQMPEYSGEALVLANNSYRDPCCPAQHQGYQGHQGLRCSCLLKGSKSCPLHCHGHYFGHGHRLGVNSRSGSAPPPGMTLPMPVDPPPHGFFEGLFMPQQYQQLQPFMSQYQGPVGEQRIVYIPYAAPPPIYVERLAKALPTPPVLRRILGDANIYEYPEMPLRTYTTRGPRDFLAPNPPDIGY